MIGLNLLFFIIILARSVLCLSAIAQVCEDVSCVSWTEMKFMNDVLTMPEEEKVDACRRQPE